ncbi:MAG: hypothetical protein O3A36_03420 [bacterium]|nr:hypothetical protein [bacterium]
MSFERPPVASPDTSKNESRETRIDFSPEVFFTTEIGIVRDIALEEAGVRPGENLTREKLPLYLDWFEKYRELYLRVAEKQHEPEDAKTIINVAFHSWMANDLALFAGWKSREGNIRHGEVQLSEKLQHDIAWQSEAVHYLANINAAHDGTREKSQQIFDTAKKFWEFQARVRNMRPNSEAARYSFEKVKNGVLRPVALEYILHTLNKWEITFEQDPRVDAIDKIDMIATSPEGNTFFIQVKPASFDDVETRERGWYSRDVGVSKENEDYLHEFQAGIFHYAHEHNISQQDSIGVYIELSAGEQFIHKMTGMPSREFANDIASYFKKLNNQRNEFKKNSLHNDKAA